MAWHVTDDGARVHYRVDGAGELTVVFVHGWCSNLAHWDAVAEPLAVRHRVVRVDRRGHGRSDVTADGYTAERHAADLAQILRYEAVEAAVVVGHAGGGPATLALAAAHPELISGVVLIDTIIGPAISLDRTGDTPRRGLGGLIDQLEGDGGEMAFARMYAGFFSEHAGDVGRDAIASAREVPMRVAVAELASLAIDSEALAASLVQPVLWLSVAAADQERLDAVFADVSFAQVVGSGHFPHLEVPDQVRPMIERFIDVALGC